MDSVIIIFITIIILQDIVDCNGIRLRKQGRQLQTHGRRLNVPDGFRIWRRSNNFYAAMGSLSQATPPPEREHKLGARMSRIGNSMDITYGENLDISDEENVYPEYRRAIAPQTREPVLVLALLPSEKEGTPDEDRYRFYQQNDRRSPELNIRPTGLTDLNFTEQKRAINLLELPIAHYVKDYHKIELEIQKREEEMRQMKLQRQGADISPPTTTGTPVDYLLQSYDKFKEEMMHKEEMVKNQNMLQNQKTYQVMQDEDRNLKKETLMQQYENKQNKLYNNNYESRLQDPRGNYPQASGQSQHKQYPRLQVQYTPISRPQIQVAQVSRPQMQDARASEPQAPDNILVPTVPRPQDSDPPPIQFEDTEALSQHTPDQQNEDLKFDDEIYNSLPNWQAEPSPPNLAAVGIEIGDENYNLQSAHDGSSVNLASWFHSESCSVRWSKAPLKVCKDMTVERLVSEYRKLEKEIVRRKKVLESYKKSLNMAQPTNDDQYKKPYVQPSPSTPSSAPSPPGVRELQGLSGLQGLRDLPGLSGLPEPPDSADLRDPPGLSDMLGLRDPPGLSGLQGIRDPPGLPGLPDSTDLQGLTRPTQRPVVMKEEARTEFSQPYLSDSELATLFTPQKKRYEETTEAYQFNPDMYAALRLNNKTVEKRNKQRASGHKLPTGIVTYRKSYHEPRFDQLYVIYLQRIRRPRKWRHRRRPTGYQYAYLDLEHLEDLIKRFRRLRAGPQITNVDKKKGMPTLHDDPAISSDVDDEPTPAEDDVTHKPRFLDTADAFNHVKIDQDAPDMKDFMPKVVLDDHGDRWWFYHQEDYNPFID